MNRNTMFSSDENIDYTKSTKKTFGGRKVFVLIAAILAAVSDLALLIVFAVAGYQGIAIPIVLLVLDALFIVGIVLTNFRFKYSVGIWTAYIVLSVVVTSVSAVLSSGDVSMTGAATALNAVSHIALYIAAIAASLYPILKRKNKIKVAMISLTTVAVVAVGAFAVFFSVNGYFGQGFVGESRVVGYTLDDDTDTYIATSIKRGRSDKVVIPEEFNGKQVSGINCSIFADSSINLVNIESLSKLNFYDTQFIQDINLSVKVGVDKNVIESYRELFLEKNDTVALANSFYPTHLSNDERYVTFAYDKAPQKSNIIPTWIGKAGDKFNFDYAEDNVEFLSHIDCNNVSDLVWCFENNNRKILANNSSDAQSPVNLVGKKIDSNITASKVSFQNIYKVIVEDDNDSKYEPSDDFKKSYDGITGKIHDYRFVVAANGDALTGELEREGFNLSWNCRFDASSEATPINSLKGALEAFEIIYDINTVYITPVWELQKPKDVNIYFDNDKYIYGNDVTMSASATAPNADCYLEYSWNYLPNGIIADGNTAQGMQYKLINVHPNQSGLYRLTVRALSDKTSLTSSEIVYETLKIDKRALSVKWEAPTNMVYDGNLKDMTYAIGEGEFINGDVITQDSVYVTDISNVNAGSYTASIVLQGSIDEKYFISNGSAFNYTIAPLPVNTEWEVEEHIYDGSAYVPQASAVGLYGYNLPIYMSSAEINAGTYTARAYLTDSNYVLIDDTIEYVIKQKSVSVIWGNTQLVYNGIAQCPQVSSVNGLVGSDNINSQFIYGGYSSNINVGEGYKATVSLPSTSNYKFDTEQSASYNIIKRNLRIHAVAREKAYDGKAVELDFAVDSGLAIVHTKKDLGSAVYSGNGASAIDAGTYSVTVSLPVNDITKNYDIVCSYVTTFVIEKARVNLIWSDVVINSGKVIAPQVVVQGQAYSKDIVLGEYIYRDAKGRIIDSIPSVSGVYSVEVTASGKNYIFTDTRKSFSVNIPNQQTGEAA